MADQTGGFLDWVKSKITDPSTDPSSTSAPTGTLPVGTGGRKRQKSIDDAVESATGDGGNDDSKVGRMKQAQSTDRDNSYSY